MSGYRPNKIGPNIHLSEIIHRMSDKPLFRFIQHDNIFEIGRLQHHYGLSNKDMYDLIEGGLFSFYYSAIGRNCIYQKRPAHWSLSKHNMINYFKTGNLMVFMNADLIEVGQLPSATRYKIREEFSKTHVKINHDLLNKLINLN